MLKVNDVNEAQQVVSLTPGKSQVVNFEVARATPGAYNVSVEGLSSSFQVQAGAASGNQPDNGTNWPVLGVIAVGGLLVIVFVIVSITKKGSS